jgi:hyaluronan synthase
MNIFFIFSFISLFYIIYIYLLWFKRKERSYPNYFKPFSVIIPCYNEGYDELVSCVSSCLNAEGNKQVILVNNNSTKHETRLAIKDLMMRHRNLIVCSEERQGKRFAHSKGLKYAKYGLIVFVDSDTIIERNAFIELIKPFRNQKVGAVAGQIKVMNKDKNTLTRSMSAMFWTSCNIFRKASSSIGYMGVIAGALGAYRKDLLIKLEHDYINQKFLGKPCSISDDRYLTMRIQMRFNKDIEYCEKAIGYTYVPHKVKQTWRMLERWRRGVLRESLLVWKEPFWRKPILMLDVQFNFLFIYLIMILRVFFFYSFFTSIGVIGIMYSILWFFLISSMYSTIMMVENTKEFPYKLVWSFFYEFFFIFTVITATLKIRNQGAWATR